MFIAVILIDIISRFFSTAFDVTPFFNGENLIAKISWYNLLFNIADPQPNL